MDYYDILISILGSTIRLSIPLIFTALAGLFSERAGIFDIGLEGKMLASAFAAACVAYLTGSAWLGLARRHRHFGRLRRAARLCLDHQSRQPDRFGRGHQLLRRRHDHRARPGLVRPGRAHAAAARRRRAFRRSCCRAPTQCRSVPIIGPLYADVISGNNMLDLSRLRRRAALVVDPLPHPLRPAPARRRRKSGGGRHRRHLGDLAALPRGHLRRYSLRLCRHLSVDRPIGRLHPEHVGRQGLYRARGADLRQVEAGAGDVRLPAVRLPRRLLELHAGQGRAVRSARCRCRFSRRCPIC